MRSIGQNSCAGCACWSGANTNPKGRKQSAFLQIEPLGGGYYEPVLPALACFVRGVALPDADTKVRSCKIGQLVKLTEAVMEDFGVRRRGAWLAERVWEPHLPRAGTHARTLVLVFWLRPVSSTPCSLPGDTHFIQAGFAADDLTSYAITDTKVRS